MNLLISSIGNKTNLVKYFRRALFNEGAGRIIGADQQVLNNARLFVDEFLEAPASEDSGYANWLLQAIQDYDVSLYVPSRDGELLAAAAIKQRAAKLGCYVAVSDEAALQICLDKRRFYRWCDAQGIAYPSCFEIAEVKECDLPLFVKPAKGSGGVGTLKIIHWQDWLSVRESLSADYIVQTFMTGPEYSVDVCVVDGALTSVVPRRRQLVAHGESIRACIELDESLIRQAGDLACQLGLEGHAIIQCFKQGESYVFSEVNARYGGGFTLGVEAGADTCRQLVKRALGKSLAWTPVREPSLELIRLQKDVFRGHSTARVYCFDLDGTICSESCVYEEAQPMPSVVQRINALYDAGHEIVIATARGASSGTDWRELIEQQLQQWGLRYHRLVTQKPYADYYIDNKAIDIGEW